MANDISYTPSEVAEILKISKYTVYEMIKRGELAGFRIGRKVRVMASDLDSFMHQAGGESLPALVDNQVIICGQDIILDMITRHLGIELPGYTFLRNQVGSMSGLTALYYGQAHLATAHLWDGDTDEYNISYIRRVLPGQHVQVINLVYRTQGFYVAQGNPQEIRDWPDLIKTNICFVNREPGSGTRVLLDEKLYKLGIDPVKLKGYAHIEMTHLSVASCVARGEADVGMGTEKAARQVNGIDFVPVQKERYDLVLRRSDMDKPYAQAMLNLLHSNAFRNEVNGMGGYDISRMGEIMSEI
jgi:putative molybdopterin biosynthesis protein